MKKIYNSSYFNRKNWILENFDKLNINNDELVLILLIEFCSETKKVITYDYLIEKLHTSIDNIDKTISSLVSKNYLIISTNHNGLCFDIDNIFEFDPEKYEIIENKDLYETLGDILGKPLTPADLQKVNDLLNIYSELDILEAARIAEANKKLKLSYIEGILRNVK